MCPSRRESRGGGACVAWSGGCARRFHPCPTMCSRASLWRLPPSAHGAPSLRGLRLHRRRKKARRKGGTSLQLCCYRSQWHRNNRCGGCRCPQVQTKKAIRGVLDFRALRNQPLRAVGIWPIHAKQILCFWACRVEQQLHQHRIVVQHNKRLLFHGRSLRGGIEEWNQQSYLRCGPPANFAGRSPDGVREISLGQPRRVRNGRGGGACVTPPKAPRRRCSKS